MRDGLFYFNSIDYQRPNRVLKNTFKKYEEIFGWYCVILLPLTKKAAKRHHKLKFKIMSNLQNKYANEITTLAKGIRTCNEAICSKNISKQEAKEFAAVKAGYMKRKIWLIKILADKNFWA